MKDSAPAQTTEVQYRGRRGGAVAAGAAVGFIAGAAIGSAAAQNRYYNDPYYAYAPGPTYYAEPAPSYYYAQPAPQYYADPGYAYAPAPGYRRGYNNPAAGSGCKSNGQTGTVGFDTSQC